MRHTPTRRPSLESEEGVRDKSVILPLFDAGTRQAGQDAKNRQFIGHDAPPQDSEADGHREDGHANYVQSRTSLMEHAVGWPATHPEQMKTLGGW